MEKSKSIAGIVGPTLIVMVLSELKLWNPTLYDTQIVPLVYFSGVLLFVAGIAIVRSHNIWTWSWHLIITIIGCFSILLGCVRMFFPQLYLVKLKNDNYILSVELLLISAGIFLTFKAYTPEKS